LASLPPLLHDGPNLEQRLTSALHNYKSLKSYLDILFPLSLTELWATLVDDYMNKRQSRDEFYGQAIHIDIISQNN
jgi:hypothetical protein